MQYGHRRKNGRCILSLTGRAAHLIPTNTSLAAQTIAVNNDARDKIKERARNNMDARDHMEEGGNACWIVD